MSKWITWAEIEVGDTVYGLHFEDNSEFIFMGGAEVVEQTADETTIRYPFGDAEKVSNTTLFYQRSNEEE